MGSPRCSSANCEDGSAAPQGQQHKTATAARLSGWRESLFSSKVTDLGTV